MLYKTLATGLVRYRCYRTSSALEGRHLHLHCIQKPCAKHASLRTTCNLINRFDFHWTVRQLIQRGRLPAELKHLNVELLDQIAYYLEKLKLNKLDGWERKGVQSVDPKKLVQHGHYYALESEKLIDKVINSSSQTDNRQTVLQRAALNIGVVGLSGG
eukprot:g2750.t1